MPFHSQVKEILDTYIPIALNEMDRVMLMNRVDTKYVISLGKLPALLSEIQELYKVLEICNERCFNYTTTYLDTENYLFYYQHATGKSERNKVRYRNYESTGTTYLEIKKRTNKSRTIKWRIENKMTPDRNCDERAIEFIREYIPLCSDALQPRLINRFRRMTLVGSTMKERVTIDFDLTFSDMKGNQTSLPSVAIVEMKREGFTYRSPIANVLKTYSCYPTGFSKYFYGTALLCDVPRRNSIKPKLLLIRKIENELNQCIHVR
jgi:hypothetical protein